LIASRCNQTTGYYRGKPEKSNVLEFVGARESRVKCPAARIQKIKSASVRAGDHLDRAREEDYR
jgi:hypothetical protein